ncbi:hypothetical protein DT075_12440 [Bacillus licheniformis]|nr:hypothetical protein DT075_12440 [Bacillus licheniformis]
MSVVLLTGATVSVAGAIGFIGLIIPHITRFLVGVDYRWIIPCSAVHTAVGTFLSALSTSIAIHFDVARDVSFWYAGGVAGTKWLSIQLLIPAAALGLAVVFVIARSITVLSPASPEIMSVTHGSAFAIAVAFAFFPGTSSIGLMIWSFAGAALGAGLVFGIGMFSKGGLTPVKLALADALSIALGAADIKLGTVWDAIFHFDAKNTAHQIIQELRLPRTVSAALVGACLAVSGAVMQGMTRNPRPVILNMKMIIVIG